MARTARRINYLSGNGSRFARGIDCRARVQPPRRPLPHPTEPRRLLDDLLTCPGLQLRWPTLDLDLSTTVFLASACRQGDLEPRYFSTLTCLGTPHDITG